MSNFQLTVIRGKRVVSQYSVSGDKAIALKEAKRLATEIHCGSVVSVENSNGLVVGVAR